MIARLFRQIGGGHTSRFALFCSSWRLLTMKMIKSVKVFPFSFWKNHNISLHHKNQTPAQTCKMAAKWYNSSHTRIIYGVYNCSTLHNDHDIENIILKIKNKIKIEMSKIYRLQAWNGEKQADKRKTNKNRVTIVKDPHFSWLYGLPMVPWAPQKCWGLQNKF